MIDERFDLTGQVAIVTGGGTGIGAATSRLLARYGAHIVVASRKAANLERVAEEVRGAGRQCLAVPTDVRDDASVNALVERTMAELGRVDVVVNNAGGSYMFPLLETPSARWDNSFDLNVRSAFLLTQAVGEHMLERGSGAIVNISSAAGLYGAVNGASYSSAKAALQMFTRTVAMEWGPGGIRCNCIAVGLVASEGARRSWERAGLPTDSMEEIAGKPDDIAYPVLFCATMASQFMNGTTIEVTGTPPVDNQATRLSPSGPRPAPAAE